MQDLYSSVFDFLPSFPLSSSFTQIQADCVLEFLTLISWHGIVPLHLDCLLNTHLTMLCTRQPQCLTVNDTIFLDDERSYFVVLNNVF
jgi:hypothetical protein